MNRAIAPVLFTAGVLVVPSSFALTKSDYVGQPGSPLR